MVLGEAMVYGEVPVLYNSFLAAKDIVVDGKDGFLIEPLNKEEFVQKLLLLMNDSSIRIKMGETAMESIKITASEIVLAMWLDLLKR